MNIIKRLKNLWELSQYRPKDSVDKSGVVKGIELVKIKTPEKKLAKIIPEEKKDLFAEEQ